MYNIVHYEIHSFKNDQQGNRSSHNPMQSEAFTRFFEALEKNTDVFRMERFFVILIWI